MTSAAHSTCHNFTKIVTLTIEPTTFNDLNICLQVCIGMKHHNGLNTKRLLNLRTSHLNAGARHVGLGFRLELVDVVGGDASAQLDTHVANDCAKRPRHVEPVAHTGQYEVIS